ncbi:MAG: restriction endonuclease subunit S [Gemmatimonadetes bacterium]|nr:restriction endonuclease subunit S [Gemmatimonadota bacterium]
MKPVAFKLLKTLKDIARVQMGLAFRSRIEPETDGTIAVIQMRDLTEDNKLSHRNLITIKMDKLSDRHLVKRKDLIFRSRGQTTTAAIIDMEIGPAIVAAPLLRIRVASKHVLPEYLCWFVNQASAQAFLHSRATGTAMTVIGRSALDDLQVPLPDLETQERIVALADLSNKEQKLMRELAKKKEKLVNGIQMRWATEVSADGRR